MRDLFDPEKMKVCCGMEEKALGKKEAKNQNLDKNDDLGFGVPIRFGETFWLFNDDLVVANQSADLIFSDVILRIVPASGVT